MFCTHLPRSWRVCRVLTLLLTCWWPLITIADNWWHLMMLFQQKIECALSDGLLNWRTTLVAIATINRVHIIISCVSPAFRLWTWVCYFSFCFKKIIRRVSVKELRYFPLIVGDSFMLKITFFVWLQRQARMICKDRTWPEGARQCWDQLSISGDTDQMHWPRMFANIWFSSKKE